MNEDTISYERLRTYEEAEMADEPRGLRLSDGTSAKRYLVKVERVVTYRQTLEIVAESRDSAFLMGEEQAADEPADTWEYYSDVFEAISVEEPE